MNEGLLFSPEDADLARFSWCKNRYGYFKRVGAAHKTQMFHRLVLARILGRPLTPADVCDHMNTNRGDNRRQNLRLTNRAGNSQNRRSNPFRGTTRHKDGKWQAAVDGKYIGLFASRADAARAAAQRRRELNYLSSTP